MPPLAVPLAAPLVALPLNDDTVSPGLLGFGVFIVLLVATVFLFRSMGKQLKKIQAPSEADLKQQEWERAEAAKAAAGKAAKIDDAARNGGDGDGA
ncbi:hypothetical protein ACFOY4_11625 [Actinomadura syzygii]|uniref:Uncharacterized protein n=1 Tax=Actinomadura syzygii TaxID=1427538 RepID=A0A5D0U7K0_9ACTN|nr:hypothetical protein [Actinomadura syzygii]TYC13622.1 hypothetical protein FXF65_18180 [Actinomadura syzygii]